MIVFEDRTAVTNLIKSWQLMMLDSSFRFAVFKWVMNLLTKWEQLKPILVEWCRDLCMKYVC